MISKRLRAKRLERLNTRLPRIRTLEVYGVRDDGIERLLERVNLVTGERECFDETEQSETTEETEPESSSSG